MQTRQQGSPFLTELKQKLLLSPSDAARAGTRYNVPLVNSLVLYVGMQVHDFIPSFSLVVFIFPLKTNINFDYEILFRLFSNCKQETHLMHKQWPT